MGPTRAPVIARFRRDRLDLAPGGHVPLPGGGAAVLLWKRDAAVVGRGRRDRGPSRSRSRRSPAARHRSSLLPLGARGRPRPEQRLDAARWRTGRRSRHRGSRSSASAQISFASEASRAVRPEARHELGASPSPTACGRAGLAVRYLGATSRLPNGLGQAARHQRRHGRDRRADSRRRRRGSRRGTGPCRPRVAGRLVAYGGRGADDIRGATVLPERSRTPLARHSLNLERCSSP